jgi:hypothetical protein
VNISKRIVLSLAFVGIMMAPAAATKAEAQLSTPIDSAAIGGVITGTVEDATFTVRSFIQRGGQLFAVGTLTGNLVDAEGNVRRIVRGGIAIPAVLNDDGNQAACQILRLDLGPLDLDLLGLRVQLSEVNLLITAEPGPGNLLGNLLCAITGILDSGGPLSQLVAQLNRVLGAL